MKIQEWDIMNALLQEPFINQRLLAEQSGHSIGIVNRSLRSLTEAGYLDENMGLTALARKEIEQKKPKNAIILAAGYGMRMVPINLETPKALHPERWNNRNTRDWSLPENAFLNPDKVVEPAVDDDADAKAS